MKWLQFPWSGQMEAALGTHLPQPCVLWSEPYFLNLQRTECLEKESVKKIKAHWTQRILMEQSSMSTVISR